MGIVCCPIVHLSFCKAGDLPICTAVFAAPDTCAVPFAAASRPKGARLRISNDMIDRPSITIRTLDGPAATVIAATNQKRPLGRADQKGQVCASGSNQSFAPHPDNNSALYNWGSNVRLLWVMSRHSASSNRCRAFHRNRHLLRDE